MPHFGCPDWNQDSGPAAQTINTTVTISTIGFIEDGNFVPADTGICYFVVPYSGLATLSFAITPVSTTTNGDVVTYYILPQYAGISGYNAALTASNLVSDSLTNASFSSANGPYTGEYKGLVTEGEEVGIVFHVEDASENNAGNIVFKVTAKLTMD
jgi:hypothetical protein